MISEFCLFGYPLSLLLSPQTLLSTSQIDCLYVHTPNVHQAFILEGLAHNYDRTVNPALLAYHSSLSVEFCSHLTILFQALP